MKFELNIINYRRNMAEMTKDMYGAIGKLGNKVLNLRPFL